MTYSIRELQQQRLLNRAMVRAWRLAQAEARNLQPSLECICRGPHACGAAKEGK